MEKVTVIGVGKLGLCFALTLEKSGYDIVGVDVDEGYINSLNDKSFLSDEAGVNEYLSNAKHFFVTKELEFGLDHSNIIFLFVATPSLSSGRYDHTQIERIISQLQDLGKNNKEKELIIGCTTMPEYCDTLVERLRPYGFQISYNPEFIAQGSILRDLVNPDMVLIGQGSEKSGDLIEKIYYNICENNPSIHRMNRKEAEITKIALNCFLTTKIAYANMVGDIAKIAGCETEKILKSIGSDSRIGSKNLKYGYGFGGPCFPRDNKAFYTYADDLGYNAGISKATEKSNNEHLIYQKDCFVRDNDKSRNYFFKNVTYKSGSIIIEQSQKLLLAVELAKLGYKITITDSQKVIDQVVELYGDLFNYEVI